MNIAYQRGIQPGLQRLVPYLLIALYQQNKFHKSKFESFHCVRIGLIFRCYAASISGRLKKYFLMVCFKRLSWTLFKIAGLHVFE